MSPDDITILLSAAAVLAGVIAAIFGVLNWREARSASSDVRKLAELTQSSLEEARAQVPDPWVRFLVDRSPVPGIILRGTWFNALDKARIVEHELARHTALVQKPKARDPIAGLLSLGLPNIPQQTPEDGIKDYGEALADWLDDCERYEQEIQYLVWGHVIFGNDGRVPARGLRAQLAFPNDWEWLEEFPQKPPAPPDPPLRRRRSGFPGLSDYSYLRNANFIVSPHTRPNVRGPRDEGDGVVEYSIDRLLHGLPDEAEDPFILRSPGTGDFTVRWTIHAENLSQPKAGELKVRIEQHASGTITTLEEVPKYWGSYEHEDDSLGTPPSGAVASGPAAP